MLKRLKRLLHIKSRRRKGEQGVQPHAARDVEQCNLIASDDANAQASQASQAYQAPRVTRQAPAEGQEDAAGHPRISTENSSQYSLQEDQYPQSKRQNSHPAASPQNRHLEPRSPPHSSEQSGVPRRVPVPLRHGDHQDPGNSFPAAHPQQTEPGTHGSQQHVTESAQISSIPTRSVASEFENDEVNTAVDVDYTLDVRDPVVHERIKPHVHTIYEPRRTRSIHYEDHYYRIQPVVVPEGHPLAAQAVPKDQMESLLRGETVKSP